MLSRPALCGKYRQDTVSEGKGIWKYCGQGGWKSRPRAKQAFPCNAGTAYRYIAFPLNTNWPVKALLLRWLVMVYDVLDSYDVLSQLYGVLFNLLDMITLRYVFLERKKRKKKNHSQRKPSSNDPQRSFMPYFVLPYTEKTRQALPHPGFVCFTA